MQTSGLRRLALALVLIGAIASALVALDRWRFESQNRSVEITIDQQDLADFAHAFGYDIAELLRALRRAGLTSVAVYEEIGQRVNSGTHAYAQSGQQLIDAARLSPLADRGLAALAAAHKIDPNSIYISVYDAPTLERYRSVLATQLQPKSVRTIRAALPAVIAVKTQIDFFNSLGLGIDAGVTRQVRELGLMVDPRVQNNERLGPAQINAVFRQMLAGGKVGTVIFFGQRNEVLGYPYQLDSTAQAFRDSHVNFGYVEAYDPNQVQKGSQTLALDVVGQTVRVQAISKLELDKVDPDTVIGRYLLGVRERNVRVIYWRPYPHLREKKPAAGSTQTESAEQTNVEMIAQLRDALAAYGYHTGRASGFVNFKSPRLQVLYFLAALGVSAAFVLLLDLYGWARPWLAWLAYGLTVVLFWAATAGGHDVLVRKVWALGGSLTFAVLAGTVLAGYFFAPAPAPDAPTAARLGLQCLLRSVGVAALGGLFVAGLLSQAAFMIEAERFAGVKILLVFPPLVLLALYALTAKFGLRQDPGALAQASVRAWQLAALVLLALAAGLLVLRSGNQPEVGVSGLETHVRGALTVFLGARPRFKEFLIGFPALTLLPALSADHRRALAWLLLLAAGVGLADVLDTFSHIHTPLHVGFLRILNGLVLGYIIGLLAQAVYRRLFVREVVAGRR